MTTEIPRHTRSITINESCFPEDAKIDIDIALEDLYERLIQPKFTDAGITVDACHEDENEHILITGIYQNKMLPELTKTIQNSVKWRMICNANGKPDFIYFEESEIEIKH